MELRSLTIGNYLTAIIATFSITNGLENSTRESTQNTIHGPHQTLCLERKY